MRFYENKTNNQLIFLMASLKKKIREKGSISNHSVKKFALLEEEFLFRFPKNKKNKKTLQIRWKNT